MQFSMCIYTGAGSAATAELCSRGKLVLWTSAVRRPQAGTRPYCTPVFGGSQARLSRMTAWTPFLAKLVEASGIEPLTYCVQSNRSPS